MKHHIIFKLNRLSNWLFWWDIVFCLPDIKFKLQLVLYVTEKMIEARKSEKCIDARRIRKI